MCETKVVIPHLVKEQVEAVFPVSLKLKQNIENKIKENALKNRRHRVVWRNTPELYTNERYDWVVVNINDIIDVFNELRTKGLY